MASKEETLKGIFDAFNRHDVQGVLSYMTPDCVFDTIGGGGASGTRIIGHDAVGKAFAGVWASFPDVQWNISRHTVMGDRALSEWTIVGTNAEGQKLEADGVDVFGFEGDKIKTKSAYRKDRPLFR